MNYSKSTTDMYSYISIRRIITQNLAEKFVISSSYENLVIKNRFNCERLVNYLYDIFMRMANKSFIFPEIIRDLLHKLMIVRIVLIILSKFTI